MGSDVRVVVWATARADRLAELALERIAILEACWSRFRPDSELSRLNARSGRLDVAVSDDLLLLVVGMRDAAVWTEGSVDASVLGAMNAVGYDRDFTSLFDDRPPTAPVSPPVNVSVPGLGGLVVDRQARRVTLPDGLGLDPGGIGKGLASQVVAEELRLAGAYAVLVSLGGDIVAWGSPPMRRGWKIAILDDRLQPAGKLTTVHLHGGECAIATSSTLKRRWRHGHHILNPRTGLPAESDIAQATVIAPSGWQAEAAATFAIVRGSEHAIPWLQRRGLSALLLPHSVGAPSWRIGRLRDD